jgi:hypothetical protein
MSSGSMLMVVLAGIATCAHASDARGQAFGEVSDR